MKIKNMLMIVSFFAIPSLCSAAAPAGGAPAGGAPAAAVGAVAAPQRVQIFGVPYTEATILEGLDNFFVDKDAAGNRLGVFGYLRNKAYAGWVHATQHLKWPALMYGAYSLVDKSGVLGADDSWPRYLALMTALGSTAGLWYLNSSDARDLLESDPRLSKLKELAAMHAAFINNPNHAGSIGVSLQEIRVQVAAINPAGGPHQGINNAFKQELLRSIESLSNELILDYITLNEQPPAQVLVRTGLKRGIIQRLGALQAKLTGLNPTNINQGLLDAKSDILTNIRNLNKLVLAEQP